MALSTIDSNGINQAGNTLFCTTSGNVGIGTSAPVSKLSIQSTELLEFTGGSGYMLSQALNAARSATIESRSYASILSYYTGAAGGQAERMRIDSVGTVGIGAVPNTWNVPCVIQGNYGAITLNTNNGSCLAANAYYNGTWKYKLASTARLYYQDSTAHIWARAVSGSVDATISWAEDMRIDASGNLLVGTTNFSISTSPGFKINGGGSNTPYVGQVFDLATAYNTYHLFNVNATNNGYRFYVKHNGGIDNYSGNNTNLSDERTKTNIELSGGYLEKICAIPVKLFNYKDEPENEQRTLGVIAQDVEAVAPELVNQNGWLGDAPEGEAPLKSIYTTDMMFALMKAIQEQQAIIQAQAADIAALKEKVGI